MIIDKKYKMIGKISGFITAYFLFATILYFILSLSGQLFKNYGYLLTLCLVALISLAGWLLKKLLK